MSDDDVSQDASQKLIVCSVVDGPTPTGVYGYIQAWSVDSLEDNLSRQRREWPFEFLPVAAFLFDPVRLMAATGLFRLPTSAWLGWMGRHFGRTPMVGVAESPIFRHYRTLEDGGGRLFAAWEIAVNTHDVI